jgi:hypothetical protein
MLGDSLETLGALSYLILFEKVLFCALFILSLSLGTGSCWIFTVFESNINDRDDMHEQPTR